jgi:hypothetical protein
MGEHALHVIRMIILGLPSISAHNYYAKMCVYFMSHFANYILYSRWGEIYLFRKKNSFAVNCNKIDINKNFVLSNTKFLRARNKKSK